MLVHIWRDRCSECLFSQAISCIVSGVLVGWLAQRIVGRDEMLESMSECYNWWDVAGQKLIGLVVGLAIVGVVSWWMKRAERKRRGW